MTLNLTCMIVKKKSIVVKIALSYSHCSVDIIDVDISRQQFWGDYRR